MWKCGNAGQPVTIGSCKAPAATQRLPNKSREFRVESVGLRLEALLRPTEFWHEVGLATLGSNLRKRYKV